MRRAVVVVRAGIGSGPGVAVAAVATAIAACAAFTDAGATGATRPGDGKVGGSGAAPPVDAAGWPESGKGGGGGAGGAGGAQEGGDAAGGTGAAGQGGAGGAGGAVCDTKTPSDKPGCWVWTANSTAGWTISNATPDGNGSWDCCGCSPCTPCPDNTSMGAQTGVVTFDSGPPVSGGQYHRYDGFTARRAAVPALPGKPHDAGIEVTGLAASISGATGGENWPPEWGLAVRSGSTTLASASFNWGSPQCASCAASPGDLGPKTLSFTPPGATVDLVLWAKHTSSQCSSEAHGVRVSVGAAHVVAK